MIDGVSFPGASVVKVAIGAAGVGSGMRSGRMRSGTVVEVGVGAGGVVGGAGRGVVVVVMTDVPTVVVVARIAVVVVPVGTAVVVVVDVVVEVVVVVAVGTAMVEVVGGIVVVDVVDVVDVVEVVVAVVSMTMACAPAMLFESDGTVTDVIWLPAVSSGALVSSYDETVRSLDDTPAPMV